MNAVAKNIKMFGAGIEIKNKPEKESKDYCQNEEFIADCYNDQLLLQQHLPHNYNSHHFNNNYNYQSNNNYNYKNNNVHNYNSNNNYNRYRYENYPHNQQHQPFYQPQPQQQQPPHYHLNQQPLKDRVVLMTRAHYGRKKKGFCVKTDFGFVGCYENVIKQTHARCSGLRGCIIDIPDPEFDSTKPCIEDLKNYLDAEYVCLDVSSAASSTPSCELRTSGNYFDGFISNLHQEVNFAASRHKPPRTSSSLSDSSIAYKQHQLRSLPKMVTSSSALSTSSSPSSSSDPTSPQPPFSSSSSSSPSIFRMQSTRLNMQLNTTTHKHKLIESQKVNKNNNNITNDDDNNKNIINKKDEEENKYTTNSNSTSEEKRTSTEHARNHSSTKSTHKKNKNSNIKNDNFKNKNNKNTDNTRHQKEERHKKSLLPCGYSQRPWIVRVLPGQKINFTLMDFYFLSVDEVMPEVDLESSDDTVKTTTTTTTTHLPLSHCDKYATFEDRTVTFGASSSNDSRNDNSTQEALERQEREIISDVDEGGARVLCGKRKVEVVHAFLSRSHEVAVTIDKISNLNPGYKFLIKYQAVGCSDELLHTSSDLVWSKRDGELMEVGCKHTPLYSWKLTCVNNQWMGPTPNCSAVFKDARKEPDVPALSMETSLLIILAVSLAIGMTVLLFGLVYMKRRREIELAHIPERVLLQNFKTPTATTNMVDSATYTTNVPVDDVAVDNRSSSRNSEAKTSSLASSLGRLTTKRAVPSSYEYVWELQHEPHKCSCHPAGTRFSSPQLSDHPHHPLSHHHLPPHRPDVVKHQKSDPPTPQNCLLLNEDDENNDDVIHTNKMAEGELKCTCFVPQNATQPAPAPLQLYGRVVASNKPQLITATPQQPVEEGLYGRVGNKQNIKNNKNPNNNNNNNNNNNINKDNNNNHRSFPVFIPFNNDALYCHSCGHHSERKHLSSSASECPQCCCQHLASFRSSCYSDGVAGKSIIGGSISSKPSST